MNNNPNNRPRRDNIGDETPARRPAPTNVQRPARPPQRPPMQSARADRLDRSDKTFFTVAAITALAVALLIIFMLCFAINRATGCGKEPDPNGDNKNQSIPSSSTAILAETEDMGQEYIDSMIFFGDSNTDHLRSYGMLKGGRNTTQVWSPQSQTVTLNSEITNVKIIYPETGEEMTVAEAAALKKPTYLVLSLGTNGVATLTETQFKYCYKKLITAIKQASPDTKIIVQSIYPVTSWYTGFSNEKIDNANKWLLELAEEAGVKYVDTASVLKDSSGALKESFNSDHEDGYHVNAEAYEKILQYLRTHGYK